MTPESLQKKILIIEDDKTLSKVLELKLSHAGFLVRIAENGEDALFFLEQDKYNLILCDIRMPQLDGYGFLAALRLKGYKTPPVIILSNLSKEIDEKRARSLGAIGYFVKSNTPIATLVSLVKEILRK